MQNSQGPHENLTTPQPTNQSTSHLSTPESRVEHAAAVRPGAGSWPIRHHPSSTSCASRSRSEHPVLLTEGPLAPRRTVSAWRRSCMLETRMMNAPAMFVSTILRAATARCALRAGCTRDRRPPEATPGVKVGTFIATSAHSRPKQCVVLTLKYPNEYGIVANWRDIERVRLANA